MISAALAAPPLAHFGHWYVGMLYLAPVVILVGVLMIQGRRDRRAEAAELLDQEHDAAKPTDE